MDISTYVAIGAALVAALGTVITQVSKKYIPKDYRDLYALGVSVVLAGLSLLLGGGFGQSGSTVPVLVFAVIGISQTIYAALKTLLDKDDANQTNPSV